ncbi:MAG TPA: RluA family pseudouridine synthase [Urbifossiella sp.]|nr:RluA family pseudouridine synthase [Urbifossiella sp.]
MPPIVFVVDRRENGKTLAGVLKTRYGLSWAQAKRLIERRHVRVGQQVETDVARRLKVGKHVQLDSGTVEVKNATPAAGPKKPAAKPKPPPAPKPARRPAGPPADAPGGPALPADAVVYADDVIVVVNKPAGLTTMRHKEEAEEFGRGKRFLPKTLADLLPAALGAPDRPVTAVHRIDRDTSGLVVFARTRAAAEHLTGQFRTHAADRRYLALTRGGPRGGRVESLFVPDRGDGRRGTSRDLLTEGGKRAATHVKVLELLGGYAAVECRLETGRTHQVRIHLGEAGTPLCGERVYDRPLNGKPLPDRSGADRPMLHAARLGFTHPETGQPVSWDVKPPDDFAALWAKLRRAEAGVTPNRTDQ